MKVWILAAVVSFTVHAQTKKIDDCAAFFEETRTPTFEIDAMSDRDLEIEDVLYPELAKNLRTSLGQARLRFLLHHPFLDQHTIMDRQEAVRALADDVHWRRQIREALGRVEEAIGTQFERGIERLKRDEKDSFRPWVHATLPALWGSAWVAAGSAMATGMMDSHLVALVFMGNTMVGAPNAAGQERARAMIWPFQTIFKAAMDASEKLEAQESEVLRRIGDVFASLKQSGRARDLTTVTARVQPLVKRNATLFSGFSFLANRATRRARTEMLNHHEDLQALMAMIGELDVLMGLAEHYDLHREQLTFPKILSEDHPTHLLIKNGHHPYVWTQDPETSVANDIELSKNGKASRFLLLTGPNTGGKSTFLKMIGANILLAQIGAPVPVEDMRLTPLALFTNKNANERIQSGESSFEAQCRRVASILARAETQRHVLILADEILTGTSPEEHTSIERAIIEDMVQSRYIGLLATHDRKLQKLEGVMEGVRNIHVDDRQRAAFTIVDGPSRRRNAIEVLRAAGVKPSIVESAQRHLDTNFPEL